MMEVRASLRNVVFYRRNRTMDIVHKQVSLVHPVPSSESSQDYPAIVMFKIGGSHGGDYEVCRLLEYYTL
jgi:hypothetical protein